MRKDMKKVIITTGRFKNFPRYERSNPYNVEDLPDKERMRRYYSYYNQGDKLNPLVRYLLKQVGRKWNDVWSEICREADNRTITGKHLRDNCKLDLNVSTNRHYFTSLWYSQYRLYIDDKGILQREDIKFYKRPKVARIDEFKPHVFQLNGIWYEGYKKTVSTHLYLIDKYITNTVVIKKQLSGKELKALNLKNDMPE